MIKLISIFTALALCLSVNVSAEQDTTCPEGEMFVQHLGKCLKVFKPSEEEIEKMRAKFKEWKEKCPAEGEIYSEREGKCISIPQPSEEDIKEMQAKIKEMKAKCPEEGEIYSELAGKCIKLPMPPAPMQ